MPSGSKLPDWGVSLIALGALFSGVLGARSQVLGQVLSHVVSIVVLLFSYFARITPVVRPPTVIPPEQPTEATEAINTIINSLHLDITDFPIQTDGPNGANDEHRRT